MSTKQKEIRSASQRLQTRAATSENSAGTLFGMPIVANSPSRPLGRGNFVEVISPGAIRNAVRPDTEIFLFHSHNSDLVLAKTPDTMRTWIDDQGNARFEADIANTQTGRDLIVSVGRGDISGMSFGFWVLEDEWSEMADGTPLRTITEMEVIEFSSVYMGSYAKPKISLDAALRTAPRDLALRIRSGWKLNRRDDNDTTDTSYDELDCECACDACQSGDHADCSAEEVCDWLDNNCDPDSDDPDACQDAEDRKRRDSLRIRRLFTSLRN